MREYWEGLGEEVEYTEDHWRLLKLKRDKVVRILRALEPVAPDAIVHGSVARGDVTPSSDIDIVIPRPVQPGLVEYYLEKAGFQVLYREIVQATPSYIPKVYFYLDEKEEQVVSVPLAPLRPREREFYKWGGELDLKGLISGVRVPGVNKQLMLIIPTERGHVQVEVRGREGLVARMLGVSIDTVLERVRVLTRRRLVGKTGVFLKVRVERDQNIDEVIADIMKEKKMFRRRIQY